MKNPKSTRDWVVVKWHGFIRNLEADEEVCRQRDDLVC
jgi:hypothetical protein